MTKINAYLQDILRGRDEGDDGDDGSNNGIGDAATWVMH